MKVANVNTILDESNFGRTHWLMFILCLFIISFDGYDLFVYGPMVPVLMKQWGLNPAQAGIIGTYSLIGMGFGSLLFGRLGDKIGRKKMIVVSATLFSTAMAATGLTNGPSTFGICRFFAGLGIGGSFPNVVALLSEYSPIHKRQQMVASVMSGMNIGGVCAAAVGIWLYPIFGWRSVFIVGAFPLLLLPVMVTLIPETPGKYISGNRIQDLKKVLKRFQPNLSFENNTTFEFNKASDKSPVGLLVQEKRAFSSIMIWAMYFVSYYIIFGVSVWLPKLMLNAGFNWGSSVSFLMTVNLAGVIGSNLGGMAADKIGAKKTTIIMFVMAFCAISLIGVSTNFYIATIIVFIGSFGFMGGQNVAHGYAASFYPPTMRSTAMGFCFTAGRLGGILGPALIGVLMMLNLFNFVGLALPGLFAALFVGLVQDKYGYSRARAINPIESNAV